VSTTQTWAGAASGAGWSRVRPSAILMNLWAYPMMVLWTLFGIFVMFPVLFLAGFVIRQETDRTARLLIWLYGRGWIRLMRPFVRLRWVSASDEPFQRPAMVVVNHLSFFDTYFMGRIPNYNLAFAVRSWPFKMPWYGAFMRLAGYLDVESLSFEASFAAARRVFDKGGLVVFFPEGHRSRTGRMHRFHSGAFKIAHAAGVPVIPIVIRGTDVLLGPGHTLLRPTEVSLTVLPAFEPESFPGAEGYFDLRQAVKEAMENELHA
jgi:1-acyl-sn-glycerol-3-phosphate acyltransferase